MDLKITNITDIEKYQKTERSIYNLDEFSSNFVTFPKQVFKKQFDKYFFLKENDWFHSNDEYGKLISFVKSIGSKSLIASCPPYFLLNAIEISIETSFDDYIDNHTYSNVEESAIKGVGLRKSHECFFYDGEEKWAMLSDFSHNTVIVGLDEITIKPFEDNFSGLYSDIEEFIKSQEVFQGNKIDSRKSIVERYSK